MSSTTDRLMEEMLANARGKSLEIEAKEKAVQDSAFDRAAGFSPKERVFLQDFVRELRLQGIDLADATTLNQGTKYRESLSGRIANDAVSLIEKSSPLEGSAIRLLKDGASAGTIYITPARGRGIENAFSGKESVKYTTFDNNGEPTRRIDLPESVKEIVSNAYDVASEKEFARDEKELKETGMVRIQKNENEGPGM